MHNFDYIIILDMTAIIILTVLSSLSAPLGTALKIKAYYKINYVCIGLIIGAALISLIDDNVHFSELSIIALCIRIAAACLALYPNWRYWNWLFTEFFKIRGRAQ
jgi:hypothetical protein